MINFKINNISLEAEKGESILQVARRNDIYIPTMCYLAKATPNASCRMCVVEAQGVEGFVLSCNTPPTEDIEINTDSDSLYKERQNIMKLYNVNHPLQCGVCDKSGECDLQNKTLEFGVAEQSFATKDQSRKAKKWGVLSYDPSLCIMCEKCSTVCNEVVGSKALYIKPGGYKSVIDNHFTSCIQCGECISVCPVGAMASSDFKYKTNAWELQQVPSACAHCSSACNLVYEVKDNEIYRVTNEDDFDSLCGAGRFGYDFDNKVSSKDTLAFQNIVEKFKVAKSICFNSMITNEEAYLLQALKEKHGFKLINQEAKAFQNFVSAYTTTSGRTLFDGDLTQVGDSDYVITLGCSVSKDNPMVRFALSKAVQMNKAYVGVMHPIEDISIQNIVSQYFKHEVGSEEGLLAMICDNFVSEEGKVENKAFFDSLDSGYICGETSIGEEEFELLSKKMIRRDKPMIILGADLYSHPEAKNIAKMAGILNRYSNFEVLMIPRETNTLGVSLICELDDEELSPSIGYNASADTIMSALGDGILDMPALNQQEGTFTTLNKEIVPLNAALAYNGYELSDIANELDVTCKNVIDFTSELPKTKGFNGSDFDSLENYYKNSGELVRGYKLKVKNKKPLKVKLDEIADIKEFNGCVVYSCNPISQFNLFSDKAHQIVDKAELIGSQQFATAAKIKSGDHVTFNIGGKLFKRHFHIDSKFKGTVAINPDFDLIQKSALYRYQQVNIERVQ